MKETYQIARAEILHYLLQSCTGNIYERADEEWPRGTALNGFVCIGEVQKGDLVRLSSCRQSKWTVGWLMDTRELHKGYPEYLIASLDDGEMAWWSNVGISFFHRPTLAWHPEWRWTDRQFAFKRRWWNVCYKEKDAYIVRPIMPIFGEGFSVTLGTRTSHGFDDIKPTRQFDDFRKVTKAMMAACYDDCVAERERINAERKAAA